MSSVTANLNRDSFLLDRKALAIIFLVELLILFITPDLIHNLLRDSKLITYLIGANVWAMGGLVACTLPTKQDFSYRRRLFWVLFFAPLIGVFVGAGVIEFLNKIPFTSSQMSHRSYYYDVRGKLQKIETNTKSSLPFHPAENATPVFFARHEIPAGTALTVKNVYAAGANLDEEEGRIMVNEKNYLGEKGSPDSIILRKTKRKLKADESIKNVDIVPPYSDEFILHQNK